MKRIFSICLALCLLLSLAACKEESDTPVFSTKKASDDFSDLYKNADTVGDALMALTVNKVETVEEVIEYYAVSDTTYTKVTATLLRDFSGQVESKELTVLFLGTSENFPNREKLVEGRSYLLKLKNWVHEDGMIWLNSPLESAFLRVFEGEILVHESADDLNYKKALTLDEFAQKYKEYQAEHPLDPAALQEHYAQMLKTLQGYDYQNKDLAYHLDETAINKRLTLAESLAK